MLITRCLYIFSRHIYVMAIIFIDFHFHYFGDYAAIYFIGCHYDGHYAAFIYRYFLYFLRCGSRHYALSFSLLGLIIYFYHFIYYAITDISNYVSLLLLHYAIDGHLYHYASFTRDTLFHWLRLIFIDTLIYFLFSPSFSSHAFFIICHYYYIFSSLDYD